MSAYRDICVVGLGYIGLPTAAIFADTGMRVTGVDIKPEIIDTVNQGRAHFGEPDLDALLARVVSNGALTAALKPRAADAFILAVPTPFMDAHQPDLRFVMAAARSVAPVLAKGNLVVIESTSPVGTTEQVRDLLARERPDLTFPGDGAASPDVNLAYCPERVLPGRILAELVANARVIGGLSQACAARAKALYQSAVKGECNVTDARTAELAKLAENSFRDVNIAFANELSVICDKMGIDVWELIRMTNLHPRVNILQPGPGVGGHCIAVDPWFIVAGAPDDARLIRTAREVNDAKPHYVVEKVRELIAHAQAARTVACFGLAYKADVDDLRESPAVEIVASIAGDRALHVLAVEPHVSELPQSLRALGVELADRQDALKRADILVLLVDHRAFKEIGAEARAGRPFFDARGIW